MSEKSVRVANIYRYVIEREGKETYYGSLIAPKMADVLAYCLHQFRVEPAKITFEGVKFLEEDI